MGSALFEVWVEKLSAVLHALSQLAVLNVQSGAFCRAKVTIQS